MRTAPTRLRRSLAALVVIAALAAGLTATTAVAVAPPAHADLGTPDAWAAARWLASQVTEEGYIAGPGGDPATSNTVQTGLALAAAQIQEPAFDAIVGWVTENVETTIAPGGSDNPGAISYTALLAVAAGIDPGDFGGVDLVARLDNTIGPDGMYGGAVEGYDPTYSAAFNQGLAITALVGAGEEVPATAIAWLVDQQCDATSPEGAVGGWEAYRADTEVPCTAPSTVTFTGPDTSSTALALQGLAAVGEEPGTDPLPYLHSTQDVDGGFPFLTGSGSDPNSTALVIQALVALGEDTSSGAWSVGDANPFTSLLSWQIPTDCSLVDAGGFASPFSGGAPDQVATQQAVWGVAGTPFPLAQEGFYGRELAPYAAAVGEPLQATVLWLPPVDSPVAVRAYEVRDAEGDLLVVTSGDVCMVAAIGLPEGSEQTFTVTAVLFDDTQAVSEPTLPVTIEGPEKVFTDVDPTHPFYAEVNWAVVGGITEGYDDGTFRPANPVTRQAMAAFLYRFAGEPPFLVPEEPTFSDVPDDHPFYLQIEWLATTGIATGYEDGTFQPHGEVSRQAMAAFLYRFAGEPPFVPSEEPAFSDVPVDQPFYLEIEWLVFNAITTGYGDGTFQPVSEVSRQATVAFLYRLTRVFTPDWCTCPS